MKYNWEAMTDTQKNKAIETELSFPTHMGTTKDDFIEIMRYQSEKIKRVREYCEQHATSEAFIRADKNSISQRAYAHGEVTAFWKILDILDSNEVMEVLIDELPQDSEVTVHDQKE